MKISSILAALLFLCCNLPGQDREAFSRAQSLILGGQLEEAERAIDRSRETLTPARESLLRAALQPVPDRAAAMLLVARIHRDDPVADTALVAGAAAALLAQNRRALLPVLAAAEGVPERASEVDLAGVVNGLSEVLEERRARGGDAEALEEAGWMLAAARVADVESGPLRVTPRAALPVPSPLAEDMVLKLWRSVPGRDPLEIYRDRGASPVMESLLQGGTHGQTIEAPGPGCYTMELASKDAGWRVLREIEVSELEIVAQRSAGVLIVMVHLRGEPARGATVRVQGSGYDRSAGADDEGIAVIRLPDEDRSACTIDVRHGEHVGRLRTGSLSVSSPPGELSCHVMVDRPLYRIGETVQGRVILRRHMIRPFPALVGLTSSRFDTEPARHQQVALRFWEDTAYETVIRGRTDDAGVLPFWFEIPEATAYGLARVWVHGGDVSDPAVDVQYPFEVRAFARPAVLASLQGPEVVDLGGDRATLDVHAAYASGAPAAGLRVEVGVSTRNREETRSLDLDDDGRLEIPVALHRLESRDGFVDVVARIHSPDGQVLEERHRMRVGGEVRETGSVSDLLGLEVPEAARVGEPIEVRLEGRPGARVLLTMYKGAPLRAECVVLDSDGQGGITVGARPEYRPAIEFAASERSGYGGWNHRRQHTRILPRRGPLQVELITERQTYRPGERVIGSVRTRTAAGEVIPATVTIAVVDDRIYALLEDRTSDPMQALSPAWSRLRLETGESLPVADPWTVLGRMMRGGRIPVVTPGGNALGLADFLSRAGLGAAGAAGPGGGGRVAALRSDFRATAFFLPSLRTEAGGIARFGFELPDDLTRWRITALAVSDGVAAGESVSHVETELPLSVTPLLPRQMRVGDALDVPIVVDDKRGFGGTAALELHSGSEVVQVQGGTIPVSIRPGHAATATVGLRAREAGLAELASSVRRDAEADTGRFEFPVLPDEVSRSFYNSASVGGTGEIEAPAGGGGSGFRLTLFGSRDALLEDARRYLEEYPYGCAEQRLSRILPYFSTARAMRRDGGSPSLTGYQLQRMKAGMAGLRRLMVWGSSGFAWWPGDEADPGMSALVMTGLVVARDGGIEPERYGLELEPDGGSMRDLARRLDDADGGLGSEGLPGVEEAELVVAGLLYRPELELHRRAVREMVGADQDLPAGLLARAGRALQRAGEDELAHQVLERLVAGNRVGPVGPVVDETVLFPGEGEAAVAAAFLELILAVDPDHPSRDSAVLRILQSYGPWGFGTTYGTSTALAALALDAAVHGTHQGTEPVEVTVTAGAETRTVGLSADNGFQQTVELPPCEAVRVATDPDREVFALLRAEIEEPGSSSPGWQSPLMIERGLYRSVAGEEAVVVREVHQGEPLEVHLTVRSPGRARYVALECPIPAGWEVISRDAGLTIHDDRVVTSISWLDAGVEAVVKFCVIPAVTGRVAWPPARAEAMYAPQCNGGSSGMVLHVLEARPRPAAIEVVPFFSESLPERPTLPDPVEAVLDGRPGVEDMRRLVRLRAASPRLLEALVALITRSELGGLDQRARMSIWMPEAGGLRGWRDAVEESTVQSGVVTELEPEVSASVNGWEPVLEAVADAASRFPGAVERRFLVRLTDVLEVAEWRYGAAPGPTRERAVEMGERLRWQVLDAVSPQALEDPDDLNRYVDLARGAVDRERSKPLLVNLLAEDNVRFLEAALWALRGRQLDRTLIESLLPLLTHPDQDIRYDAFDLLPAAVQRRLPVPVIVGAGTRWWRPEHTAALATTPAGRSRLLELAARDEWYGSIGEMLDLLPADVVSEAPTSFHRAVALSGDPSDTDLLYGSVHPTPRLVEELERAELPEWRAVLLEALARRGVREVPGVGGLDGSVLGAWHGDRAAATHLRSALSEDDHSRDALPGRLRVTVVRALRDHLTASELVKFGGILDRDERSAVLRRLGPEQTASLARSMKDIGWLRPGELPFTQHEAVRDALWELASEDRDWLSAVIRKLCESEEGTRGVRGRIRLSKNPDLSIRAAAEFFEITGRSVDGLELQGPRLRQAVWHRAVREGLDQHWSPRESTMLRLLLRRRGCLIDS